MSRFEKRLAELKAAQDAVGHHEDTDPMSRTSIESFVRGFDLSAAAVRLIVDRWDQDAHRHYRSGYADGMEHDQ